VHVSDGAGISTEAFRSGNAGKVTILTQNLELTSGGQVRSGTTQFPGTPIPSGAGGTITVQGPNGSAASVLIDGSGSGLFTNTHARGGGENQNIARQSPKTKRGGTFPAETTETPRPAPGGTIWGKANPVPLNPGGTLTATSTGPGAAGNITINAGTQ